jgi:hypothetical protein
MFGKPRIKEFSAKSKSSLRLFLRVGQIGVGDDFSLMLIRNEKGIDFTRKRNPVKYVDT